MLTLVGAIGNAVISLAPQLLLCGLSILESLTQGILNNMPVILTGISALFDNLTSAITTYLPQMIQQGLVIIENLATGIALALPEIIAAAINTITALVDTLSSNTGQVIDSAVRIINTLADGLLNNLPKILSAAAKLVVAIAKAIITNLPQILTAGIQIVSKLTSGLISATPQVLSAAGKVVTGVFNAFTKTNWLSVGVNIIRGIANGISSSAGYRWNGLSSGVTCMYCAIRPQIRRTACGLMIAGLIKDRRFRLRIMWQSELMILRHFPTMKMLNTSRKEIILHSRISTEKTGSIPS